MVSTTAWLCADCGQTIAQSPAPASPAPSENGDDAVEFWWCRDCVQGVCKKCHLLKGHTEHRTNAWKPEEVYRSCVQSLEGRCSRRSQLVHEQKVAIKEFLAKVEIRLLNELSRAIEKSNEPDRRLIQKMNRYLVNMELRDDRPNAHLYHVPSPARPAYKTWALDTEEPKKMGELLDTVSELLQLPRREPWEDDPHPVHLKDRSEWDVRGAAEMIAQSIGAAVHLDNVSQCCSSRAVSPGGWSSRDGLDGGRPFEGRAGFDRSTPFERVDSSRRRGASADAAGRGSVPVEATVFIRGQTSVMSFRERSVPLEDQMSSPEASNTSQSAESKPGSVMSSIPAYPNDSVDSSSQQSNGGVTPTPAKPLTSEQQLENGSSEHVRTFGSSFLTRPICVQTFDTHNRHESIAVSDSCGGVYVCSPEGQIQEHVLIKNSSASSIAIDEKSELMYVSVMQSKGRSVHVFDIARNFKKVEVIPCPKDPRIELSRTRWLCVGPRGDLFMTSGDNVKSAVWTYVRARKGWKTLKQSRKTRYQYLSVAEDQAEYRAVVLLTCDAANNRLLLFVIDGGMSLISEYDLSKTYRLPEFISSPASAIVDKQGNLLVLDYASGRLWILLSSVKGIRRLKEISMEPSMKPQEALGITVIDEHVLIACFATREVRAVRYLENGVFKASAARSPSLGKRSSSLPRPPTGPESAV